MHSIQNMDPETRKGTIMQHLETIAHNHCDTIQAFGLKIDENFKRIPARQLHPPIVVYRDSKSIKPKNGKWPMQFGCDEMQVVSTPTDGPFKWAILNTTDILDVKLQVFAKGVITHSFFFLLINFIQ